MLGFFVISTELGGAEKSLLDLTQELNSKAHPFRVVVPKSTGPLVDEFKNLGIPIDCLPLPPWILKISRKHKIFFLLALPLTIPFLFFYFYSIHQWVKKNKITAIHSTGLKYHLILGCYCSLNKKIKLIVHLRDIIQSSFIKLYLRWMAHNHKVVWISNSKVTAESIHPIESHIIYNGFPPLLAEQSTDDIRKKLKLPKEIFLVGIVGVIARWKGQREFLGMAKKLVENGYSFHFLIVGDEIYDTSSESGELQYLKDFVNSHHLEKYVHFLGFQKKIAPIYKALDVLVHSSIAPEPFGRVIVESMQNGCVVTASNQGGPKEIITPHSTGLLHEPGHINSMVENVLFYFNNPKQADQISRNAIEKSQSFSMSKHIAQISPHLDLS